MKTPNRISAMVLLASFVLAACGGGGGGGDGGGGGGGSPPPATGKSWGTAQLIAVSSALDARIPKIAFDTNGNAIAVWVQYDGTRYNVWANRYTPVGGWESAQPIETSDGDANHLLIESTPPQVAFDASGNALAVWTQSDGTRWNIWSNRYAPGSGWGTAQLIETDNVGNAGSPHIAFDSNGSALAIWRQRVNTPFLGQRFAIRANRYIAGTGWGTAVQVDVGLSIAENSDGPQIAIGPGGAAIAVWQQSDGTRYNIMSNRYVAGIGWGTPHAIESNAGDAYSARIGIDASGNAIVVWQQYDGWLSVWANRYSASTNSWDAARRIMVGDANTEPPQISMNPTGAAIALWAQSDGTRYNIMASRYSAGIWNTPQRISNDNHIGASYPQVAIDASGNAIAVWGQVDSAVQSIWANRLAADAGWGVPQLIESGARDAYFPEIAIDANGNAIAVWKQSDDLVRGGIWANHYR